MKILLIHPPPRTKVVETIVVPQLGLLYLAAVLEKNSIQVSILDAFALGMSWEEFEKQVSEIKPDIIGMGGMTPVIDVYKRAMTIARKYCKYLVMGGPHLSAYKEKIFENIPELDYGIVGEAEYSFLELVRCLSDGNTSKIPEIPGILYKNFLNPQIAMADNLDDLPFPARHLIPVDKYHYSLSKYEPVFTLMSSRGCPYQCIFCDKTVFGSRWRSRSPENVVAEVEEIVQRYNGKSFIFYDDLFTVDKKRVIAICKLMVQKGFKIEWKCEGRVNIIEEEMLEWMKKAGCSMIAYGVESGNLHSLRYLRKNYTPEHIKKAFELTRKYKIKTLAYFILGIPGETYEQALKSIDFACSIKPDYIQFSLLSPTYGTLLYDDSMERGWYQEIDAKDPLGKDIKRAVVQSPEWNEINLQKIIKTAYFKFYARPSYVLSRIIQVDSYKLFLNSAQQGLKLGYWFLKSLVSK